MTAYDELKTWCEKHFSDGEFIAEEDNGEGFPHIDFQLPSKVEIVVWFNPDKTYDFTEVFD